MKSWSTWLVVAVVCLMLGGNLYAQEKAGKKMPAKPKVTPEMRFKKLDTNQDGSLSLDEFKADKTRRAMASKAELIFNAKDVNKDKKLSLQEFAAAQSFEEMKVLYDKDKDGSVTLEEYLAGRKGKTDSAKKVFEARDKNKDGKWTAEDFVQKKAGKKKAKRAAR